MAERKAVPNSQERSKQKEKKKNSTSSTKRVEDKGADADSGNCRCNCKKVENVIQCVACRRWCHPSCVNLSRSAVINALEADVQYFYPLCVLKRFLKDKDDNATQSVEAPQSTSSDKKLPNGQLEEAYSQLNELENTRNILSADDNPKGT